MQRSNYWWLLFFVLLFSLFWHLGNWGVTESSEARYAEIAREMLENRNWTRPQYLQILHFDKPLMTYWITAIGLKVFGINAFAIRFFLQVAFLIQLFLVYNICLELFASKKIASYATIIYCGVPLVLISIRNLTTDAYLTTFTLLASLLYILYYKQLRIKWLYAFFFCLGLLIFTKGPIGILLPLLVIYPVHQILGPKEAVGVKNYHFYIGVVISVAIGGWWFFQLMTSSPIFYDFFIKQQIIERVGNAEALKRSQPFWYYIAFLPVVILPMFTLFIGSLSAVFRAKLKPIKGLIIGCILLPLLLFSLSSSKLILYILPIMPYIAIVSAYFLYHLKDAKVKLHFLFASIVYSLMALALVGLFLNVIPIIRYKPAFYQFVLLGMLLTYLSFVFVYFKGIKKRILALFLVVPVFIIPISADIMKNFEIEINSTLPVTDFIKGKSLDRQQIMVWNRAVNSIPFQLQKSVYSLKYQHYSFDRKTQFQPDSTWNNLIDITEKEGKARVEKLIRSPSVLISADKIPQEYNWFLNRFKEKKQIGKWRVYYNNNSQ